MKKTAAAADDRWKCPDCSGWVRDDVDCHYCLAPVVITVPVPQPYPVPYVPPVTIQPYWMPTFTTPTITCSTETISSAVTATSN